MRTRSPFVSQTFKPSAWLSNIDFIKRLVMSHHLLLAVMTESLGGKSTFIDLLRLKLEPAIQTVLFHVEPAFTEQGFIADIAQLFNLDLPEDASATALIEAIEPQQTPLILILDDAHQLPEAFLMELVKAYQAAGEGAKLHLCLVSDFSLIPTLTQLGQSGYDSFIHTIEPGALTEAEMKTYVLKALQGQRGLGSLITPEKLNAFYQLTGGQVARVNRHVADFFMPEPQRFAKVKAVFITHSWKMLCLMGMLLSALGVMRLYQIEAPLIKLASSGLTSEIPVWTLASIAEPIAPSPMQAFTTPEADETDQQVLLDKVIVIPEFAQLMSLESVLPSISSEFKVAESQAKRYTIQLLASPNIRDLQRFIQVHQLDPKAVQISQSGQGQHKWYILTLGDYPFVADAQVIVKALPMALSQLKPWIRPKERTWSMSLSQVQEK